MRMDELEKMMKRRRLDLLLVCNQANVRMLTGVDCDNAILQYSTRNSQPSTLLFYTDFRYLPMVRRLAPNLKCRDIRTFGVSAKGKRRPRRLNRIGYESAISHAQFLEFGKRFPKAVFVDISKDISALRAVKTPDEIAALRAAEALNCRIWEMARRRFRAGMTEREMARIIRMLMIEKGDGEAFDTIVCVGKNAAECHHKPDDTVWNGREPVLVDMGVKLNGFCSDLTRNIRPGDFNAETQGRRGVPRKGLYWKVYELVRKANVTAIAAVRPGVTGKRLDKVARDIIRKGGFGRCFGHSLGHGVGYEIHEPPYASKKSNAVLRPGMLITIEPGIYLEGNLGVRIEDLVFVTETGCEVLSRQD